MHRQAVHRASHDPAYHPSDGKLALLLVWVAVALLVIEFFCIPLRVLRLFPEALATFAPGVVYGSLARAPATLVSTAPWWGALAPFIWWGIASVVLWIVVPAFILRRGNGLPFALRMPLAWRAWLPYLALIALMVPLLAYAGTRPDFLRTYPMLRPQQAAGWSWSLVLLFWTLIAVILVSTEFLFRGVLVFALESRLGVNAVLVSAIPYCVMHLHKPFLEALGAIVAGVVLGMLALRTRSIGGGIVVHIAVAIGMDVMALLRSGNLPVGFLP
jgi:uncharacterized protein